MGLELLDLTTFFPSHNLLKLFQNSFNPSLDPFTWQTPQKSKNILWTIYICIQWQWHHLWVAISHYWMQPKEKPWSIILVSPIQTQQICAEISCGNYICTWKCVDNWSPSMQHNYTVDLVIHDQLKDTATIPGQLQQISARAQLLLDGKFFCHGTWPVPLQFWHRKTNPIPLLWI